MNIKLQKTTKVKEIIMPQREMRSNRRWALFIISCLTIAIGLGWWFTEKDISPLIPYSVALLPVFVQLFKTGEKLVKTQEALEHTDGMLKANTKGNLQVGQLAYNFEKMVAEIKKLEESNKNLVKKVEALEEENRNLRKAINSLTNKNI